MRDTGNFVHLHVHTEYSLLDGACRIKPLVGRAVELGMKSLAITDHGVMFGVVDFYKEALKQGVKPIIGCEVYMAARTMADKASGLDGKSRHLILLAKDNAGYRNLVKLVSAGFTEGYYYRPRIDFDILERCSEGLIALSACLSGHIPAAILAGDMDEASRLTLKYKGIFGEDFYLELQDAGLPEQRLANSALIKLSQKHGVPLVVTNDVHYISREDAKAQDVLMCIQTGKTVGDTERMRMETDEFYLKSEPEMRERFKGFEAAFANTALIADKCSVEFEFGKIRLPRFQLPDGAGGEAAADGGGGSADGASAEAVAGAEGGTGAVALSFRYLRQLCLEGVKKRYSAQFGEEGATALTTAAPSAANQPPAAADSPPHANQPPVAADGPSPAAADSPSQAAPAQSPPGQGALSQAVSAQGAPSQAAPAAPAAGAARAGEPARADILERLEYELSVIRQMGYADYFLIVWDYTKFARDSGIPVGPGRGSGAGSIVAYSLGITNIDPLKYSLLFERFLNPERVSMPDIDIDFCYERRQEVIDYVVGKYGSDHVAQIITFGTMAAHLAVRDVGRVLDIPYDEVDRIAKMIPLQLRMTIGEALKINPDLKAAYDGSPVYRELIDMAMKLEGMPRHASTHAAGVLITDLPVTEYVPLQKNDDVVTTQFPMGALEELGLLKMDFLGLRTLTVIKDTIDAVRENRGVEIDIDSLDMSDAGVYGMIGDGGTCGVFQLESGGMTQFMKELQPSGIEDIIAGGALFRPGPMDSIPRYIEGKANRGRVRYDHPALEHILDVTYGCIVYQEQVMQIVRDLAGYSLGMADLVRRAMSKKKHDVMERERANFVHGATDAGGGVRVAGAVRNGVPEGVANKIFDDMLDFASYAFPKAHATAYAVVAYQTAWLKYYYPVEFMAAILNSCMGNADRVAHYMREARQMGIGVMPPDINSSLAKFSVSGGNLRFGLAAIKNVGAGAVGEIIAERRRNGAFRSFVDFLRRAGQGSLNKRGIDSMVRCGAFDSMRLARSSLAAAYEGLLDGMQSSRRKNVDGQMGLFDGMGAPGPGPGPGFGSGSGSSPGSSPDSGGAGLGSGAGSGSGLGSGSSPGSGGSSPDSGVNLGSGGAGIMGAPGYGNRPGGDFGGGMADGLPSGTANGAANGSAGDPADGFARGAGGNPAAALGYGLANVPAGGLVNGCADVLANGSANDPANGSADSLANGFANAPANGSADSLANGFANVPANGCADSLANGLGAGAAPPGAPHPDDAHIQALPEFPQSVLLNMEKEMLGLYVSGHPLDGCIGLIRRYADCDTGAFTGAAPGADSDADASQPESGGPVGLAAGQPAGAGLGGGAAGGEDGAGAGRMDGSAADARPPAVADGQAAVIGGVISGVKTKLTKSGAIMAFATLEDMNGSVEILLFPKIYEKFGRLFGADNIVLVRGRVTAREDEAAKFICEDAALVCAAGQNIGAGVGDGGAWPSGAGVGVGVGAGAGLGEGEGGAWNGAGGAGASLGGCAGGAGSAGSTGSIVASGAAGGIGSAGSVAAGSGAFADAGGAQAMDAIEGRIAEWRRGWRDWGGRSGNGGYSGNGGHGGNGGYSGNNGYSGNSGYGGSGLLSQPDGMGAGGAPHGNGARDGVYGGAPYGAPMPEYGSARRPTQSPTQSPALSPMPSPMPERWQGAPAPAAAAGPGGQTLYIRVSGGEPKALMDSTLAALKFFSGRTPVVLVNSANRTKRALGAEYGVKLCEALVSECRERFGADGVKIK